MMTCKGKNQSHMYYIYIICIFILISVNCSSMNRIGSTSNRQHNRTKIVIGTLKGEKIEGYFVAETDSSIIFTPLSASKDSVVHMSKVDILNMDKVEPRAKKAPKLNFVGQVLLAVALYAFAYALFFNKFYI
ncbi:hypothetical protein KAR48_17805 [bacterium]|nr:hypothetical protein [bacterium]